MIPYQETFDKLEVSKMCVEYTQPGDCCEDEDNYQTLRIETEDGGGGPFLRLSIVGCDHFSVDGIDTLKDIINDFYERLNYKND